MEEHEAKVAALAGTKKDVAWGNQIRSYVFHPYTMVKDHRTEHETGNIQAVMQGDLEGFIQAWLRWRLGEENATED
jgi:peptide chain release factor 2